MRKEYAATLEPDKREAFRERHRQYMRARRKAIKERKAVRVGVAGYELVELPPSARKCLFCDAPVPEGNHPVDCCSWQHKRLAIIRKYKPVVVASLPACERRRR